MTEQVHTEPTTETPQSALTGAQVAQLMRNLNPDRVVELDKGGAGGKLKYLEGWDVKATLIRVFGFANFSAEVIESQIVNVVPADGRVTVLAKATVRLTIHATGAVYTETAAASQVGKQVGEVADFALKTAETDALKRCAIYLGTQFGLSLYKNGQTGDVVKVVLDPAQNEALAEYGREMEAKRAEAEAKVQDALKTEAPA